MALKFPDRVRETTTSTGTGSIALAGAEPMHRAFAAGLSNGDTCYFAIVARDGSGWEHVLGTYTAAGNSLSRDSVLLSSNGGALVNFAAGVKDVMAIWPGSLYGAFQPLDGDLTAIGGLAGTAGLLRKTAANTWGLDTTDYGRRFVGQLIFVTGTAAPTGTIKANGALLSRASYPDLWAFAQASGNLAASDGAWTIGKYSPGDGSTTFRIPYVCGYFPRFWADGSGSDPGRTIGSVQSDDFKSHYHTLGGNVLHWVGSGGNGEYYAGAAVGGVASPTTQVGGTETRPINLAYLGCIVY